MKPCSRNKINGKIKSIKAKENKEKMKMQAIQEISSRPVRPIKAVQFGEGNFLRAFIDWQIDVLNEKTDFNGDVMMFQPLGRGMGDMINAQNGFYTTVLRGIENGKEVEQLRKITSVRGCINPYSDYEDYIKQADNPDLRFVFSNTTEAGIVYDETVKLEDKPQSSFPGKVTAFLYRRFKTFGADETKGLIFIPCELIDKNGDTLKKYVLQHASDWKLEKEFTDWVNNACDFCNSLVDRIVPGYPRAEAAKLEEKLGYKDNLLDSAESFLFWAIEYKSKSHEDELPTGKAGLNVVWTDDMTFFRTRKVRILNGAHTMSVLAAYQTGLNTVEECMHSPLISSFMKKGLFDEIIESMDGDKALLTSYAGDVLERFQNPYIVHLLLSISLNSTSKFKTRDLPSLLGYIEKKHEMPKILPFSLAALISFYEGTEIEGDYLKGTRAGETYQIKDSMDVLKKFQELYSASYSSVKEKSEKIAKAVLSMEGWWGQDLTKIEGLEKVIALDLESIWTDGMEKAIEKIMEN